MWHQLWIPVLIPTLIIKSNCDDNKKETEVFIRQGGHAEAYYQEPITNVDKTTEETTPTAVKITTLGKSTDPSLTAKYYEEVTDTVVFIPNKQTPVTRDDEYDSRGVKIKDIMMMRTVNDAVNKGLRVEEPAATPKEDIVFISGKNHDPEKTKPEDNIRRRFDDNNYKQSDELNEQITMKPKLNCNNLDCNNTVSSVCGAKIINKEWRYRLFLNECYFRKVNCGFRYEVNRYKQVPTDKCKKIGIHYIEKPFSFKPRPINKDIQVHKLELSRRTSSSRRSMTRNVNGEFCSHPCPVTCPDDYDPQCAISGTGERRVFMNHCKLDLNSCSFSVIWFKRPLADCVGGTKADMRQNRGFIGWMQRVGIVDNKGRLVLE